MREQIKISVIMVDGNFRENVFGAKYFSNQDFPDSEYEVIWVEFYERAHPEVYKQKKVKVITLNKKGTYHSSFCFNKGIMEARGEVIVIPDADQIVRPDFLKKVWRIHESFEKLVVYGYRYDEAEKGSLKSLDFEELEKKTFLRNPTNYGGCLTVRKKWLIEINGYEQHEIFSTGFHANGLDIYTRFKNYGLAIMWHKGLKLYHPWHPFTLKYTVEQKIQKKIIEWRRKNLNYLAFNGIDRKKNVTIPDDLRILISQLTEDFNNRHQMEKLRALDQEFLLLFKKAKLKVRKGDKNWEVFLKEAINIYERENFYKTSSLRTYRLASSYEKIGNLNEAIRLFEKLTKKQNLEKNLICQSIILID